MRNVPHLFVLSFLIVSPAMFQSAAGFDVVQYRYGETDPVALLNPTLSGYDFVFTNQADNYPVMGLACSNTPYPYISAIPLDGQLSFDERMLLINGSTNVPFVQGMGSATVTDSRVFLTNNDIWAAFREEARVAGEASVFGTDTEYSWPTGNTYNGPNVVWGLPQDMNEGTSEITVQYPMIRTDYRAMSGDDLFFDDRAITTWMRLDNGARDLLEADGSIHADNDDFRGFLWQVTGGVSGGNDYFNRYIDGDRERYGNYTAYRNGNYYFKIQTGDNGLHLGPEVMTSYAYMLQWNAFYGSDRYEQGPNGFLEWRPQIHVLSTGFPGAVLQSTNSMQLIDSFYLDEQGESYSAPSIHVGDMIVTMRTSNVEELAAGLRGYAEGVSPGRLIPLLARDNANMSTTGAAQSMFLNSYALVDPSEEGQPLLRHDNATADFAGKIVGYHVRPVYDVFADDVDPKADDTMYVPGYDFSNNRVVTCRPFVWGGGGIASPEIIQYGDPVRIEPNFDCSRTYHLPNIKWAHDWGVLYDDVVPDDYCTVRPEDEQIPVNSTVLPPPIPVYRDMLEITFNHFNGTDDYQPRLSVTAPYASDIRMDFRDGTVCGVRDQVAARTAYFELQASGNRADAIRVASGGGLEDFFYNHRTNPLTVSCHDFGVSYVNGSVVDSDVGFSLVVEPETPFYLRYLDALAADDWGWGTGTSSASNSQTFGEYQGLIMGMPLVSLLGVLTAFVGFSRGHIPAAGITYALMLGAMTYFGLIDLTSAAFGAIVTFVILLIFSKGFK